MTNSCQTNGCRFTNLQNSQDLSFILCYGGLTFKVIMVVTKSEYSQAFLPKYEVYGPTYEANLGFRNVKRRAECSHDTNPFEWYPDEDEGEEVIAQKRPASMPVHIYKHMLYNKAYTQRHSVEKKETTPESEVASTKDQVPKVSGKETQANSAQCQQCKTLPAPAEELTRLDLNATADDEKNSPHTGIALKSEQPHVPSQNLARKLQPKRPKRPTNKMGIPKARPSTAPPTKRRQSPRIPYEAKKAPFVPYGYEDKERETCKKMTHNVRASSQVYPAAVIAFRRRKGEVEERQKQRKAMSARVPKRNYFDMKMTKETSEWNTEYREQYTAHDEKLYRASLSARTLPRAATA